MPDIDAEIDALYQGPLEAFTDARNALAKSAKRADIKTLQKPSLPAWAVNQLFWHRRPVIENLVKAAEAVRIEHGKTLAGKAADIRAAEQAHRDAVKDALAEARTALGEAGHPLTAATLDAVRDTLQVLPSPEANGRLTRPLAPQGFAALAGFTVAPGRADLRVVPPRTQAAGSAVKTDAVKTDAVDDDAEAEAEAARARAKREAERAERERRKAAEKALESARAALQRADIALDDAERVAKKRRAERDLAAAAHEKAQRNVDG
jgi:hypothetical protein